MVAMGKADVEQAARHPRSMRTRPTSLPEPIAGEPSRNSYQLQISVLCRAVFAPVEPLRVLEHAFNTLSRQRHSRPVTRYQTDLTDADWRVIAPHLPKTCAMGRPREWPMREIVDGLRIEAGGDHDIGANDTAPPLQ